MLRMGIGEAFVEDGLVEAAEREAYEEMLELMPKGEVKDFGVGTIIRLLARIAAEA